MSRIPPLPGTPPSLAQPQTRLSYSRNFSCTLLHRKCTGWGSLCECQRSGLAYMLHNRLQMMDRGASA